MVWLPDCEKIRRYVYSSWHDPRTWKKSPFSRTAAHIFVSPGDAPGAITLNVVLMEREFDAYKQIVSQHVPICLQQFPSYSNRKSKKIAVFTYCSPHFCFPWRRSCDYPMRKSKNRYFYHIFVSPGYAPEAITLNVVWMERKFDAYKLSRCKCPSTYNRNRLWDRARYLWKILILSYPLAFNAPVRGVPVGMSAPPLVRKN